LRLFRKAAVVTLGCPKNDVDSEILAGQLVRSGIELVVEPRDADVIYINTCGFIEAAKRESIDTIFNILELKKQDPAKKIYVWGCLAQRYGKELAETIPEVDGYFGVEPFQEMLARTSDPDSVWDDGAFKDRVLSTPPHTAYLKIADGCSHECTFCAIPLIKGPYRSRPMQSLWSEAESLVRKGIKELILIAQDTGGYGMDLKGGDLVALLKGLVAMPGLSWIRMMYLHPSHIHEDLLALMEDEEKICRYVDIPLQHIDDTVLKAMRRPGNGAQIRKLIGRLRKIPDISLRTAFIVGFPGETDRAFQTLLDFVQETRFERLGAFVFSPEEGTAAYTPDFDCKIGESRYHRLMETQQPISLQINQGLVGRTLPVLIDGRDGKGKLFFGRTQGDAPEIDQTVRVKGAAETGEIVRVRITSASAYDLEGRSLEKARVG